LKETHKLLNDAVKALGRAQSNVRATSTPPTATSTATTTSQ